MQLTILIKKNFSLAIIILTLILFLTNLIKDSTAKTIYVENSGIQEAIDIANEGDTIFVYDGVYYERIIINKSIKLIGENREKTIINGMGNGSCIEIKADNVYISNFTIINGDVGIKLNFSSYNKIFNCNVSNNNYGVYAENSVYNEISHCIISFNNYSGIWLIHFSSHNIISNCSIYSNKGDGIHTCCGSIDNTICYCNITLNEGDGIETSSWDNKIFLNNFVDNNRNAYNDYFQNYWDNGKKGNYWSDFDTPEEGAYDNNSDGIVDQPYNIPGGVGQDRYPLIQPFYHNQPPTANFTYNISLLTVQFNDTSYDIDGFIVNYTWNFGDGNISYEKNPVHQYAKAGTYNVTLTVKDDKGAIASITKKITISKNHPPVKPSLIYPADGAVDVALNITLKWECSDPDGDSLKYDVYFGESLPLQKIASNISKNEYVPSLDYGKTYYWRIVAWDEHGAKNESNVWHFSTIQKPNIPPTVVITYPKEGETVSDIITIQGEASDIDGEIIKVEISIDSFTWRKATGTNRWSYELDTKDLSNGKHKIYARAYDGKDYSSVVSITVTIKNKESSYPVVWGFWFIDNKPTENATDKKPFKKSLCQLFSDDEIMNASNNIVNEVFKNCSKKLRNMLVWWIYLFIKELPATNHETHSFGMSALSVHYFYNQEELPKMVYDLRIFDKDETGKTIYERIEEFQEKEILSPKIIKLIMLTLNISSNEEELKEIVENLPKVVIIGKDYCVVAYKYDPSIRTLYIYDPRNGSGKITFDDNYNFNYNGYNRICNYNETTSFALNNLMNFVYNKTWIFIDGNVNIGIHGKKLGEYHDGTKNLIIVLNKTFLIEIVGVENCKYNLTIVRGIRDKTIYESREEEIKKGEKISYDVEIDSSIHLSKKGKKTPSFDIIIFFIAIFITGKFIKKFKKSK